jgi:hypothetical protein
MLVSCAGTGGGWVCADALDATTPKMNASSQGALLPIVRLFRSLAGLLTSNADLAWCNVHAPQSESLCAIHNRAFPASPHPAMFLR